MVLLYLSQLSLKTVVIVCPFEMAANEKPLVHITKCLWHFISCARR